MQHYDEPAEQYSFRALREAEKSFKGQYEETKIQVYWDSEWVA